MPLHLYKLKQKCRSFYAGTTHSVPAFLQAFVTSICFEHFSPSLRFSIVENELMNCLFIFISVFASAQAFALPTVFIDSLAVFGVTACARWCRVPLSTSLYLYNHMAGRLVQEAFARFVLFSSLLLMFGFAGLFSASQEEDFSLWRSKWRTCVKTSFD